MKVSRSRCLTGVGVPSNASSPLPNSHLESFLGGLIPTGPGEVFPVLLLLLPLAVLLNLGCIAGASCRVLLHQLDPSAPAHLIVS